MATKDNRPIKQRVAEFGAHVLLIMHHQEEWSSSTMEMISTIACDLDLPRPNHEQFKLPSATKLACETIADVHYKEEA